MSIEKSHFFDRIGAVLTILWTLFEPAGSSQWGRKVSTNFRHPSVRGILRPAKIGRAEVSMIRLKSSRSEPVRLAAAFLAVNGLAPSVLAQRQARTCFVDARVLRYGRENLREGKAADLQDRSRHIVYAILATRCVVRSDAIQSAANRAALMAPEDPKSMYLQRLEDSNLHRLWRLINALGKVRQGALEKKDVK